MIREHKLKVSRGSNSPLPRNHFGLAGVKLKRITGNLSLVSMALRGNGDAWNALVERFSGVVFSLIRSLGIGEKDAGDLTVAVFEEMFDSLEAIHRGRKEILLWLARKANEKSLAWLRESGMGNYRAAYRQREFLSDLELLDPGCQNVLVLFISGHLPRDKDALRLRNGCLGKLMEVSSKRRKASPVVTRMAKRESPA